MTIRPAVSADIPALTEWLESSGGEAIDLARAIVFVAEEDGAVSGFIAARMVWQIEPLLVRPDVPKLNASRAAVLLYRAFEAWLISPDNLTGVHWFFAVTRSQAVQDWAKRLGWSRIYRGAKTYCKHLKVG